MKLKSQQQESGMTMTDYIIIVALVAIACLALAGALGYRLHDTSRQAIGALNGESLKGSQNRGGCQ